MLGHCFVAFWLVLPFIVKEGFFCLYNLAQTGVGELTFDVGESTSYVGELVVGEAFVGETTCNPPGTKYIFF